MQFDAEILFWIFPDRFYQVARLDQHLVGVGVESVVLKELTDSALPGFEFRGQFRKFADRVIELLCQLFVLCQLAQRALAGIDIFSDLLQVGDAVVGVVSVRDASAHPLDSRHHTQAVSRRTSVGCGSVGTWICGALSART